MMRSLLFCTLVVLSFLTISIVADNVVIVTHYGATGNGVTDDSQAIMSAVQALQQQAQPNGNNILWFPTGSYVLSGAIPSYQPAYITIQPRIGYSFQINGMSDGSSQLIYNPNAGALLSMNGSSVAGPYSSIKNSALSMTSLKINLGFYGGNRGALAVHQIQSVQYVSLSNIQVNSQATQNLISLFSVFGAQDSQLTVTTIGAANVFQFLRLTSVGSSSFTDLRLANLLQGVQFLTQYRGETINTGVYQSQFTNVQFGLNIYGDGAQLQSQSTINTELENSVFIYNSNSVPAKTHVQQVSGGELYITGTSFSDTTYTMNHVGSYGGWAQIYDNSFTGGNVGYTAAAIGGTANVTDNSFTGPFKLSSVSISCGNLILQYNTCTGLNSRMNYQYYYSGSIYSNSVGCSPTALSKTHARLQNTVAPLVQYAPPTKKHEASKAKQHVAAHAAKKHHAKKQ